MSSRQRRLRPAVAIALLLGAVSLGRGLYVLWVEHPERSLYEVHLARSPWHDAMRWVAQQPLAVHVLADPGHAWKYGTSVRVAAGRDVLLEDVKDSAVAMYSHAIAGRFNERVAAIGNFDEITPAHAHALAERYDLDYLVTVHDLALPLAYRNDTFRVYALRPSPPPAGRSTTSAPPASAPAS